MRARQGRLDGYQCFVSPGDLFDFLYAPRPLPASTACATGAGGNDDARLDGADTSASGGDDEVRGEVGEPEVDDEVGVIVEDGDGGGHRAPPVSGTPGP